MKRGIFTSITVVLLAAVLLYLVSSIALFANSMDEVNSALVRTEAAGAQADSAASAIRRLETSAAVGVSFGGNNVTFGQNLSNLAKYRQGPAGLADFLADYGAVQNVSVNASEASMPRIYLHPQNITLVHSAGKVELVPQNSSASAGSIMGFDVLLLAGIPTPRLHWDQITEAQPESPNALRFHFGLQGTNGTVSDSRVLDRRFASTLRLLDSANQTIAVVQSAPPAALGFASPPAANNLYLTVILQLNTSPGEAELGKSIVAVDGGAVKKVARV